MAVTKRVLIEYTVSASGAITQMRAMNKTITTSGAVADSAAKKFSYMKAAFAGFAIYGVMGLTRSLISMNASIIDVGTRFQSLQVRLNSVMGSVEGGARAFQYLQDFAKQVPYTMEQMTKSFILLQQQGIDPTKGMLQGLAEMGSALGSSSSAMDAIVIAITQIAAAGRPFGQEMRQLKDRLVPVFKILKDELGLTEAQIRKVGDASVSAEQFMQAMLNVIQEKFGGASAALMKKLPGAFSVLRDAIDMTLFDLGETAGGFTNLATHATEAAKKLHLFRESAAFEKIAEGYARFLTTLGKFLVWTVDAFRNVAIGFEGINRYIDYFASATLLFLSKLDTKLAQSNVKVLEFQQTLLTAASLVPGPTRGPSIAALEMVTASLKKYKDMLEDLEANQDAHSESTDAARKEIVKFFVALADGQESINTAEWLDRLLSGMEKTAPAAEDAEEKVNKLEDAFKRYHSQARTGTVVLYRHSDAVEESNKQHIALKDSVVEVSKAFEVATDTWSRLEGSFRAEQFGEVVAAVGDAFYEGMRDSMVSVFSGEEVEDAWGEMVDSFSEYLAEKAANSFSESIEWFATGQFKGAGKGQANLMAALGVAGGLGATYAADQGDTKLAGAISGAMAGLTTGQPWMALVGAIVGYFMAPDAPDPTSMQNFGFGTSGSLWGAPSAGGALQGPGSENRAAIMRQMASTLRANRDFFRDQLEDLIMATGDLGLFGALAPRIPGASHTGEIANLDAFVRQWLESEIPNQMQDAFAPAFAAGLEQLAVNLGVAGGKVTEFFSGFLGMLKDLPASDRQERFGQFMSVMIEGAQLMGDLTREGMMSDVGLSAWDQFGEAIQRVNLEIGAASAGFGQMDMVDRTRKMEQIQDLVARAREMEIQMLEQIHQLGQQITDSIASQREGFVLSGMGPTQRFQYFMEKYNRSMMGLSGATDPEDIARFTADAQGALQELFNLFQSGDSDILGMFRNMGMSLGGGPTTPQDVIDWFLTMLQNIEDEAGTALGRAEEEVLAGSDKFLEDLRQLFEVFFGTNNQARVDAYGAGGTRFGQRPRGTGGRYGDLQPLVDVFRDWSDPFLTEWRMGWETVRSFWSSWIESVNPWVVGGVDYNDPRWWPDPEAPAPSGGDNGADAPPPPGAESGSRGPDTSKMAAADSLQIFSEAVTVAGEAMVQLAEQLTSASAGTQKAAMTIKMARAKSSRVRRGGVYG